jgi:hypothetical protein
MPRIAAQRRLVLLVGMLGHPGWSWTVVADDGRTHYRLYATKRGVPSRRAVRSVCHMIAPQVLRLGAGWSPLALSRGREDDSGR